LIFTENEEVKGLASQEQEQVMFFKLVDVNEGSKKGSIEIWLQEIEDVMHESLRLIAK